MASCLQLSGEYLWVAEGKDGMQAYDVANVANKNFSERIISAPFSPLGHRSKISSKNATCVAMPTTQPLRPERSRDPRQNAINLEQPLHPIYSYVAVTDAEEGLILVNVETMHNFEPRDNFFTRALTWNPDGILDGAVHATFMGHVLWVSARRGLVAVDLDQPLEPKVLAVVPLSGARAAMGQFRYLFAVDADGLQVIDVTDPGQPRLVKSATIPLAHANRVFVSRTYAYVAAGSDGLVIVDIEKPEQPKLYTRYTADGAIDDARDVIVGATNASLFAYVADRKNGLKVIQLLSPGSNPGFYGYSPDPKPELIAWRKTRAPALALSRPLERDRGVDETGHQVAVFGRIGSRPFTLDEQRHLYMKEGRIWTVSDEVSPSATGEGSGAGSACKQGPELTAVKPSVEAISAVAE
jgi:hypothetical protein